MKRVCLALLPVALATGVAWAAPTGAPLLVSAPPFDEAMWQPSDPTAQDLSAEHLQLRSQGVAYSLVNRRLRDTSILTEFTFHDAAAAFLGVRVQANPPLSGYVLDLSRQGGIRLLEVIGGEDTDLASGQTGFDLSSGPLMICYRLSGRTLSAWIWPKGGTQPEAPTLQTFLAAPLTFEEGRPLAGVRGGGGRFSSIEVRADVFRPLALGILLLPKEPRFKLSWNSTPNEIYGIDTSPDRSTWRRIYRFKASAETSEAVIPGSFSVAPARGMFFRVVKHSENVQVPANLQILAPPARRIAVSWVSSDDRVYGFEWSTDLTTWHRHGALAVEGAPGLSQMSTVLSLPERLRPDTGTLFLRVIDLEDSASFGILPVVGVE